MVGLLWGVAKDFMMRQPFYAVKAIDTMVLIDNF
jgi:hypothetical protein